MPQTLNRISSSFVHLLLLMHRNQTEDLLVARNEIVSSITLIIQPADICDDTFGDEGKYVGLAPLPPFFPFPKNGLKLGQNLFDLLHPPSPYIFLPTLISQVGKNAKIHFLKVSLYRPSYAQICIF